VRASLWFVGLVLGVSPGLVSTVSGATTASTYVGGGMASNFDNATGFYFVPRVPIVVEQLGIYDMGAVGFASTHDVGIFLSNGTAVVTAGFAVNATGQRIDDTVFVAVAPTPLADGTEYYILGGEFSNDGFLFGNGAVRYAPEIIWTGIADGATNSIFSRVTRPAGEMGNLGPNFRFTVVPEPVGAGVLLVCGVALLRRRRRR
jgi:hypothetical protein